jgi:hypothetical protein
MEITLLFTALLGLWFCGLSVRTIVGRRTNRISLGSGESDDLLRRVRTHANFSEYIPLLLFVLFLLELQGVSHLWLILYGVAILLGRALHAYGLSSAKAPFWARVWGMQLTLWPLLFGSIGLLLIYFF